MRRCVVLLGVIMCVLSGTLVLPVKAAPPSDSRVHVVQRGENLTGIAWRYGTTAAALIEANRLTNPNWIYVGQRLSIPSAGSAAYAATAEYHVVRPGQSLETIAAQYRVSTNALARANGIHNPNLIFVGQRLRVAGLGPAAETIHVVRHGEALAQIARRYGVTVSGLVQANGLNNPNFVYVGQRLRIPAGGSAAVVTNAATAVTSKLIDIDLSSQRMTVWENGRVKWYWVCSTGEPGRATYPGHFGVISKIPNAYSSVFRLQMPWWLGVYWAGSLQNGIHALPLQSNGQTLWAGLLGQRVSYGCIILDTENARALYYWADIGTPVTIHY
jgi:LysM repeat protein